MIEDFNLRELDLAYEFDKKSLICFLQQNGLRFEEDITVAFGVFDTQEKMVGCGCAAGRLMKCFAVDVLLRGQNVLGPLISRLMQNRFANGYYDLFVITRAENEMLFVHCGMYPLVRAEGLVLLENHRNGPEKFAAELAQPEDEGKLTGCIIMNCNPFTKGHRALIEYAATCCELLHIFIVEEDRSTFSTSVRYKLVKDGTADLPNVRVHLSGPYIISAVTFPTYFLKKNEDVTFLQASLDITLFAEKIAPALHITRRFAGQEPFDPTTERYNDVMRSLLPNYGIEFCEIPRLCQKDGVPISASLIRSLLAKNYGVTPEILSLVPDVTAHYLTNTFKEEQK